MLSIALAAAAGILIGRFIAPKGKAVGMMTFGGVSLAMVAAILAFATGATLKGDVQKQYPLLPLDNGSYVGLVTTGEGVRKVYRYEDAGQAVDARSDVTVIEQFYDANEPYIIIHYDKLKPPASLFALRIGSKDPEFNEVELHLPTDEFFDRGKEGEEQAP